MKFNKGLLLALGVAIALTFVIADSAMAWNYGDVFAAVGNGRVNRYAANGAFVEQLNTGMGGFTTGMAFDASSNLYVTGFSAANVVRFAPNSALLGSFGGGYTTSPESIVFDKSGNAYVGHADGTADIKKMNSAGVHQAWYNVATEDRGSDWIDLAADQKTMFYTSEGEKILRYDISTGTQLADFAGGLGRPAFALRILGDGGVLVATQAQILRLNAAGAVIQSYDVAGENTWFALNINPDGNSFWSGSFGTGIAYEFDIATGANTQTINTGAASGQFFGLTVFGEQTQGGPDPIPEPGTLALLGLGLAGVGYRLRRKS